MGQPGLRLHGEGRRGACGLWRRATTARGRERGVLRLDPALVAAPDALARAAAGIEAVRRLDPPGVMRTADLVTDDAGRIWLVTEAPAGPTAADLLGRVDLGPASVAAVVVDVATALAGLHAAGLAHGALSPDTVVVAPTGSAVLIEVGLAAALRGFGADPAADAAAWADLVGTLDAAWAGGAGLFGPAAATARSDGLAAALDAIAETVWARPDLVRRYALVTAAAATPARAAAPTPPDAGPSAGSRTLLPEEATRPGRRGRDVPAADRPATGVRLRFGPGVPPAGPRPVGRATPPAAPTPPPGRPPNRRRRRAVLSGLLTLALAIGVVGVLWWRQRDPLDVTAAEVTTTIPAGSACDVTVDVVGTVRTNGRAGTFSYRWVRSDGGRSEVLDQSVAAGVSSVRVHLYWTFRGRGTYRATATLQVVRPTATEAAGVYTYACGG
jgi:hypothetical protein